MPISVQILPELSLVYGRHSGHVSIDETLATVRQTAANPAFQPGFRHLLDLSEVTSYERDYVRFFDMQAQFADTYFEEGVDIVFVFLAPTKQGVEMGMMAQKSWAGVTRAVISIVDTKEAALDILGLSGHDLSRLVASG